MLNTVAILPFSRHSIATEYPCIEVVHQYHSDRGLGGGGMGEGGTVSAS